MTSFRLGGPVDIYIEPANTEELAALLRYLHATNTAFLVLGNGSNILISDGGFRGVAVNIEKNFSALSVDKETVTTGAGARLSKFVDFCVSHGLAGTEMLAGIPGTIGGAVIMNAGAYGGEISDHLVDVTLLRDDHILTLPVEECGFRYRNSDLRGDIILSARFELPRGNEDQLRTRRKELLLRRNAAQPVNYPNAGSIFKNPEGQFAARLIEECGLKGQTFGGARISELHANFIINSGDSTSANIVDAINHVRRVVFEKMKIELELEIQLIGFPEDVIVPLQGASQS